MLSLQRLPVPSGQTRAPRHMAFNNLFLKHVAHACHNDDRVRLNRQEFFLKYNICESLYLPKKLVCFPDFVCHHPEVFRLLGQSGFILTINLDRGGWHYPPKFTLEKSIYNLDMVTILQRFESWTDLRLGAARP